MHNMLLLTEADGLFFYYSKFLTISNKVLDTYTVKALTISQLGPELENTFETLIGVPY